MLSNTLTSLVGATNATLQRRAGIRRVALRAGSVWRINSTQFFKDNLKAILAYGSAVIIGLGLLYAILLSALLHFNMVVWSNVDDLLLFGAKASPPAILVVIAILLFYTLARAWASNGPTAATTTTMSAWSRLFARAITAFSPAAVLGLALVLGIAATAVYACLVAHWDKTSTAMVTVSLKDRREPLETYGIVGRTADYIFVRLADGSGAVVSLPKDRVMCVAAGDSDSRFLEDSCGLRPGASTSDEGVKSIASLRDYARFMESCALPAGTEIPSLEFVMRSDRDVKNWSYEPVDNFGFEGLPGVSPNAPSDIYTITWRSAARDVVALLRKPEVRTLLILGLASQPAAPTYNLDLAGRRTASALHWLCQSLDPNEFTCPPRAHGGHESDYILRSNGGPPIYVRRRAIGKGIVTEQTPQKSPDVDQRAAFVVCG